MSVDVAVEESEIAEVVRSRAVTVVFQPVFDLSTTEIVGFEALARGPQGTSLESPHGLFGAAHEHGLSAELDWVCRAAAFTAFMEADAPPALTLLVNALPESFGTECPHDLLPAVHRAEDVLRVMIEVNDRSLAADPAELLVAEHRARSMGWGIALDDIGTGRGAIAMIPIVRPDVVKIDLAMLRKVSEAEASSMILAATRHAELTGASLCVESIENEGDARWARALGAAYGQGHHLGRPGPLPSDLRPPRRPIPLIAPSEGELTGATPWEMIADLEPRRLDPDHFVEWARIVARGSIAPGAAPVILAGAGRGGFDDGVAATFPAQATPLLAVAFGVGVGVSLEPIPGLRGVQLDPADPLAQTLFLVVISANGVFALLGKAEPDGKILSVMTQDPSVVDDIARHIIRRVPRVGSDGAALSPPAAIAWEEAVEDASDHLPQAAKRRLFPRR